MSLSFDPLKIKEKKILIWTRSEEDWTEDRLLLERYSIPYIHLPCVSFEKVETQELCRRSLDYARDDGLAVRDDLTITDDELSICDAVIFTSPRAVFYALQELKYLKHARIFCFGKKTQSVLENHGFSVEFLSDLRSAKEIPNVLEKILKPESKLLLPGPQERAFDLEMSLRKKHFKVESLDLYKTVSKLELSNEEKKICIEHLCGTVFFASPSACRGFVESLEPQNNRLGSELLAFAIGPTSAECCKQYFTNVHIASENSIEKSLQEYVHQTS